MPKALPISPTHARGRSVVQQRPPVSVPVLISDGQGNVLVNTQITDFVHDHVHYKFDLVALPAGEHTPPLEPARHTIENADPTVEGWLPADDPVFNGKAPANAQFGYNIGANAQLNNLWPPIPVNAASLEMLHKSVFVNVNGIHKDVAQSTGTVTVNLLVWTEVSDIASIALGAQAYGTGAWPS